MNDSPFIPAVTFELAALDELNFAALESLKVLAKGLSRADLAAIEDPDEAGRVVQDLLKDEPSAVLILETYFKSTRGRATSN